MEAQVATRKPTTATLYKLEKTKRGWRFCRVLLTAKNTAVKHVLVEGERRPPDNKVGQYHVRFKERVLEDGKELTRLRSIPVGCDPMEALNRWRNNAVRVSMRRRLVLAAHCNL